MASLLLFGHTIISILAALLGVPVVWGLVGQGSLARWTGWFLFAAVVATVTGFLFPFTGITPAFAVGLLSSVVLAATLLARYVFRLNGVWKKVWILGLVVSEFFLVFVTVAQAFAKVPGLKSFAPAGAGPVFGVTEALVLALFVLAGFLALRRGRRLAA